MMAELSAVSIPAINQHLKSLFGGYELEPEATVKKYLIVQTESCCYQADVKQDLTTVAVGKGKQTKH